MSCIEFNFIVYVLCFILNTSHIAFVSNKTKDYLVELRDPEPDVFQLEQNII